MSEADLAARIASVFSCPSCSKPILPPSQCREGHLICFRCQAVSDCPSCREADECGAIRNRAMEMVAQLVPFACEHAGRGCTASPLYGDKRDHEQTCDHRPCPCPCPCPRPRPAKWPLCRWQGEFSQVFDHLATYHGDSVDAALRGEDVVFVAANIGRRQPPQWTATISCLDQLFFFTLEKSVTNFYAFVQLIGTRNQAVEFTCELQLGGSRRRLTWRGPVRSVHETVSLDGCHLFSADRLVFDKDVAIPFTDAGSLSIGIKIMPDDWQ